MTNTEIKKYDKARCFGRVDDKTWALFTRQAKRLGMKRSQWMTRVLINEIKRQQTSDKSED